MDFFARQQHVRRMSSRLVLLFILAVISIVLVVDLATVTAFKAWGHPKELVALAIFTSIITALTIGLASLFRTTGLRSGGGKVALELGGVLVPQDTTDPQLRRLRNVVEEVAIASGVAVPEIYVLPNEDGINAFAAGWSPSDAAIAVTRGSLERLNRDELQGVIAHEFSHVVNGDMRLNIRLMGLIFGLLFMTVVGRWFLQFGWSSSSNRSRDDKNSGNNPLPFIGIALVIAGFVGVFAGQIIQASVSRRREYLADASAVQFTRQTAGIAGALKKIGGLIEGSQLRSARKDEVGHMLFGSGKKLNSLYATHPPLLDRIKVLEPGFDANQLEGLSRQWTGNPPSGMAEDVALGFASAPVVPAPRDPGVRVQAASVVGQVAAPTGESFQRASEILKEIPADLLDRGRSPAMAVPLVLALLLAADPQAREAQYGVLAGNSGEALAKSAWNEGGRLAQLDPHLRIPLAQVAFPALRQLSRPQQEELLQTVFAMIRADGRITAFEYCLSRLLMSDLQDALRPKSQWRMGSRSVAVTASSIATLLAVLAMEGASTPDEAAAAFQAGMAVVLPDRPLAYAPPPRGVVELESVWDNLDALAPSDKSLVVQATVAVISQDGRLTVTESELLRTVCSLLHAPLPPLTALAV